ncbi:putative phosphoglycerate mutase family protein [Lyophyllum shimeji]|uniref:Phosphoglycerate mutase family protein n=1 Tax=Lyophyllum shimeji TaxID=47721 RepID=A0A9P3UU96_LYOSH|nr:putative phosphoglycerate mutase family protein [Lyophyllum shimeji]
MVAETALAATHLHEALPKTWKSSYVYTAIPGFFAQDDSTASVIPALPPRFGLLDDTPDRWTKFFDRLELLNEDADADTSYKVFFLGRHGQGYHNVAEAKYGTQAWDDYWSKLNGDGELVWGPDPELTTLGKGQAVDAQDAWKAELAFGIRLPEKLYCSPLTRALRTCEITFDGLLSDQNRRPIVLENCREENGVHTCDKRRTRSYIEKTFPRFEIETGFTEEDELWDPDVRETKAHIADRAKMVLDHIFEHDKETFISITAHGGIIQGFLACVGRPHYTLPTGGVLPLVIKSVYTQGNLN